MDTLTHIAIGACIGEAIAGHKLGKKAMLWGAFAQSIPDFDVIASFWLTMDRNLLAHRGITHSIFFVIALTPLLSFAAFELHKRRGINFMHWIVFFAIELLCHMFLDTFNNYGIGWLEPFYKARFSFNTIYVVDPIFTIWSVRAFIVLLILKRNNHKRKSWWKFGLIAPAIYLAFGCFNKMQINSDVNQILKKENIPSDKYFSTPTPMNCFLWYVVAATDSGLYSGYRSVFDSKKEIAFTYFPKNEYLLNAATEKEKRSIENLKQFSQGFYTIQNWNDTLVFNDLRFGQIIGWHDPNEKFVFHYFIQHEGNKMAVQRGRFAKWNKETMRSLIRRIKGN
jgi:inner membrane protein